MGRCLPGMAAQRVASMLVLSMGAPILAGHGTGAWETASSAGGYLTTLQGAVFSDDLDSLRAADLVLGRINLGVSSRTLSAALEARSRVAYGDQARSPGFADAVGKDAGAADLSWNLVEQDGALWNLAVDRAWIERKAERWEARVGRQRINWGMALAWNPNDLFNASDFLDLHYAEGPGSDAARLRCFPAIASGSAPDFDLAAALRGDGRAIAALRVGWNRSGYDFQLLSGWYMGDVAVGGGWAGNLGDAGFKGEATWFRPWEYSHRGEIVATATGDYSFAKGLYANASVLYNSSGSGNAGLIGAAAADQDGGISPKNPFPSRWAFLVQTRKSFTLLWSGHLGLLYAPDAESAMALPRLAYSLAEDWELEGAVISLVEFGGTAQPGVGRIRSKLQFLSLRLRWSV